MSADSRPDADLAAAIPVEAARAAERGRARTWRLARDLFADEQPWTDAARRSRVRHMHDAIVDAVDTDLRARSTALMAGQPDAAQLPPARPGMAAAGWLGDARLVGFLSQRVDEHRLVIQARVAAAQDPELVAPDRFGALMGDPDPGIAEAATLVLTAELRRFGRYDEPLVEAGDLPRDIHARLVWRTAAALRNALPEAAAAPDRAIATAAGAMIAAREAGVSLEAAADRLAARLPAGVAGEAMIVALATEGHVAVAVAGLARRARVPMATAWDMVADPDGACLILLLRAAGLARASAAALLLRWPDATTTPDRIADRMADHDALDPAAADGAIDAARLDGAYHAALTAFERATAGR